MDRKFKTLTRDEYEARLKAGWQYRGAYLYELDDLDKMFVYVQLSPTQRELKCVIRKPK